VDRNGNLSLDERTIVLACVLVAYASSLWPEHWILSHGLAWLGYPPYAGFRGKFLPHALLYSTLTAVISAILWLILSWRKLLPPIALGRGKRVLPYGMLGAIIAMTAIVVLVLVTPALGKLHWIGIDPWGMAGNLFSNFYEEFIFRGFILAGLTAVIGFWPAAIVSSALWAAQHTQYPLSFQATICGIGIVWCWIRDRARTLWAPYLSHEIMDTVLDAVIG
jgi:membrane protease YdiL (CAAX protease family)